MVTNRIRSEIELCRLNYSAPWLQKDGTFSPAVSRYTEQELRSGLPFHVDNEPVRFTRNKKQISHLKGHVEVYALNWLGRYNRLLEKGILEGHKRLSEMRVRVTV